MSRGESALAYVAVTCAKQTLRPGGVAWIDDQLAGGTRIRPARCRRDDRYDVDIGPDHLPYPCEYPVELR